ncbi:MAG TPA: DUF2403 domain-containing protein, partial [Polyangiaceae bacterium]|nr:DUF2403 domain-containing protein [Polyangiaceae bacterium]
MKSWCPVLSAAIIALACGSSGQNAGASAQGGTSNSGGGAGPAGGGSTSLAPGGATSSGGGPTNGGNGNGGAAPNGGSTSNNGGNAGQSANGGNNPGGAAGETSAGGSGGVAVPVGEGDLGPPEFAQNEIDAASTGATITFLNVGSPGWYPSRRELGSGMCDIVSTDTCCMTQHDLTTDQLTPWNEELSMTLRGPMVVKQIVAYQPGAADTWARVSAWDSRGTAEGIAFWGNDSENGFSGQIGSVC